MICRQKNGLNSHAEEEETESGESQRELHIYYCDDRDQMFLSEPEPEDLSGYVKMPVEFDIVKLAEKYDSATKENETVAELVFILLNQADNPLGTDENQDWIRENMEHGHTSMSVADIVEIDGSYYYCKNIGFRKIDIQESG